MTDWDLGSLARFWRRMLRSVRQGTTGRAFARDATPLTAAQASKAISAVVQGIIVARILGPEGLGLAALVMAYPAAVYTVFTSRSGEAGVKYCGEFLSTDRSNLAGSLTKLILVVDVAIAIVAIGVVSVTSEWAATSIIGREGTAELVLIYSLFMATNALKGTTDAILISTREFNRKAGWEIAASIVRPLIVVTLLLVQRDFAAVVIGNGLAIAFENLGLGLASWPVYRRWARDGDAEGRIRDLGNRTREIIRFIVYTDLDGLLGMAYKQLDTIALGWLAGPTITGYYKLAKSVGKMPNYLVAPLNTAVYPRLAFLWGSGQRRQLASLLRRHVFALGAPLGLLGFAAVPLLPFVVVLLVGDSFAPAAGAAQWFMIASMINLMTYWIRPLILTMDGAKFLAMRRTASVAAFAASAVAFVPFWGHTGMAAAWTVVAVVSLVIDLAFVRKGRGLSIWHGRFIGPEAATSDRIESSPATPEEKIR